MTKPQPITRDALAATHGMPMQPIHDAHGDYHGELGADVAEVSGALAAATADAHKVQRFGNIVGELLERRSSGARHHIIEYASHRRTLVVVFIAEFAAGLMPGYFMFRPGARRLDSSEKLERWAMTIATAASLGVVAIIWALAFGVVVGAVIADSRHTNWAAFRPGMDDTDPKFSESALGRQVALGSLVAITTLGVVGLIYLNRVREAVGSDFEVELPWIVLALPGVLIAVFAGVIEAIWHSRPIAVQTLRAEHALDATESDLATSMSTYQRAAGRLLSRARSVSAVQLLIAINQLPLHNQLLTGLRTPTAQNRQDDVTPDAAADGGGVDQSGALARPLTTMLEPGVVLEAEWAIDLLTKHLAEVAPKVDRWWLDPALLRQHRRPVTDRAADAPAQDTVRGDRSHAPANGPHDPTIEEWVDLAPAGSNGGPR